MTVPVWLVAGWGIGTVLGLVALVFLSFKDSPPSDSSHEKAAIWCLAASAAFGWPLVILGFLIFEVGGFVKRRRDRLDNLAKEVLES